MAGPQAEGNGWNAGGFLLEGKFSDLTGSRQSRTISLNFRVESRSVHGSVGLGVVGAGPVIPRISGEGPVAAGLFGAGLPDVGVLSDAGQFCASPVGASLFGANSASVSSAGVTPEARAAAAPLRPQAPGWVELEVAPANQTDPVKVRELFLAGSRPLPEPGITCISRHPWDNGCFVAGTQDGRLLLLDAHLPANLQVLQTSFATTGPLLALIPCGEHLLGLSQSKPAAVGTSGTAGIAGNAETTKTMKNDKTKGTDKTKETDKTVGTVNSAGVQIQVFKERFSQEGAGKGPGKRSGPGPGQKPGTGQGQKLKQGQGQRQGPGSGQGQGPGPGQRPGKHPKEAWMEDKKYRVPLPLVALAENDARSFWGLTADGQVYLLGLPEEAKTDPDRQDLSDRRKLNREPVLSKPGRKLNLKSQGLERIEIESSSEHSDAERSKSKSSVEDMRHCSKSELTVKDTRQLSWFKGGLLKLLKVFGLNSSKGCSALAYDGRRFWLLRQTRRKTQQTQLSVFSDTGRHLRSFFNRTEVAISSLSYCHHNLLILDRMHQQLHLYHLADTLETVSALVKQPTTGVKAKPGAAVRHPGFLEAGGAKSGGIHNLCLLYVGGEGSKANHRYDLAKLLPLVGYVDARQQIRDCFMDGFLMLAQYSPLLNGKSFGLDLSGGASQQEDWIALFEEYFQPNANLAALENAAAAVQSTLKLNDCQVKVVLTIPTVNPQVEDWDGRGSSITKPAQQLEVTRWAMHELLQCWRKAGFKHLQLAGFYYMTEQGSWDDPVLHAFPKLCRQLGPGLRSFAIPGITSSWLTEFTRAGFDCVSLQPSHAFWHKPLTPRRYLLKLAGRIAREYGMGVEVELPYDVEGPSGREKVYDYLEMAAIQGWAGSFKAYFQSYNLIKTLAESTVPETRKLYDDLYQFSQISYKVNEAEARPVIYAGSNWEYAGKLPAGKEYGMFRLNIEGNKGPVRITNLKLS